MKRVRWQKKHVFGGEGTVARMGCQTLAFVGWHFSFLLISNLQSCYCCVTFSACVQRSHGMFLFGNSRHQIRFTKINLLKISRDAIRTSARMKYTVCCTLAVIDFKSTCLIYNTLALIPHLKRDGL